jgi:hypothetical protein
VSYGTIYHLLCLPLLIHVELIWRSQRFRVPTPQPWWEHSSVSCNSWRSCHSCACVSTSVNMLVATAKCLWRLSAWCFRRCDTWWKQWQWCKTEKLDLFGGVRFGSCTPKAKHWPKFTRSLSLLGKCDEQETSFHMVPSIPKWVCWYGWWTDLWSDSGSIVQVILLQGWSVDPVHVMQMSLPRALMAQFPAGTDASVEAVVMLKSSVHVHVYVC